MNQLSGGSRILWQAAAAAGAFRQDMLNLRYMYPFKLARSMTIIVFRTEYESTDENYAIMNQLSGYSKIL